MPSRYRAHVQTGMSWFSGLASVPALIGMGMCRHTLRIPRVSNKAFPYEFRCCHEDGPYQRLEMGFPNPAHRQRRDLPRLFAHLPRKFGITF